MLVSLYHLNDVERVRARRLVVRESIVTVGSDPSCTITIGDDPQVGGKHVQISVRATDYVIMPLAGPTLVNGVPATGPTVCQAGDTIQIGETVLKMRPEGMRAATTPPPGRAPTGRPVPTYNPPAPSYQPPRMLPPPKVWRAVLSDDPIEQQFLVTLREHPDDEPTRLVYADWLEQRGQMARSDLVRGIEYPEHDDLLAESDPAWRAIVSSPVIEECDHPGCPRRWILFSAIPDDERLRQCRTCTRPVRYCLHVLDVTGAVSRGERAVRDAALAGDPHPGDTIEDPSPRRR